MSKKLNTAAIVNELHGQSVFFKDKVTPPTPPLDKTSATQEKKARDLRTSQVPELPGSQLPKLRTYELRNFDQLRRLDIRLTGEQKRFLDEMEETIRQQMPEGERDNPMSKRITKNSIVRVFVEIFRQLRLKVDASNFKNESDLLEALFAKLLHKVTNLRTSEVTD